MAAQMVTQSRAKSFQENNNSNNRINLRGVLVRPFCSGAIALYARIFDS